MAYKLVHYINQFFAGIGGEDKADVSPEVRDGIVGPGMAFKAAFNGEAEIVATFICGDNYCANHLDDVAAHMVETVKAYGADGLIAGPAFNAGRYGTACGAVCAAVAKELQLPVVSGMYRESPGVDLYRKEVTIVETADSARGMGKAVPAMAAVMLKLLKGGEIADPEAAGVFPKGIRKNMFYEQPGAERAVQMLIKKLNGEAFRTEYPMPAWSPARLSQTSARPPSPSSPRAASCRSATRITLRPPQPRTTAHTTLTASRTSARANT